MVKMTPSPCVQDVWVASSDVWLDNHGYYTESHWEAILKDTTASAFVWERIWYIQSNVVKGLYLPKTTIEKPVYTLLTPLDGEVVFFIIDIRQDSPTEKKVCRYELSMPSKQILIPPGCAYGFFVSGEFALVSIKQTQTHPGEIGINWNDSDLNVPWPTDSPKVSDGLHKFTSYRNLPKEFIVPFVTTKFDR